MKSVTLVPSYNTALRLRLVSFASTWFMMFSGHIPYGIISTKHAMYNFFSSSFIDWNEVCHWRENCKPGRGWDNATKRKWSSSHCGICSYNFIWSKGLAHCTGQVSRYVRRLAIFSYSVGIISCSLITLQWTANNSFSPLKSQTGSRDVHSLLTTTVYRLAGLEIGNEV